MYNIKVYDSDLDYKYTINPLDLRSKISFTENELSGQGQCVLSLDYDFDDTRIEATDVIRVYKNLDLLYSGVVGNIERNINNKGSELKIPLLGLASVFSLVMYPNTNENQDPAQTIKDIVDTVSTVYDYFSYDSDSIKDFGSNVSIDFENQTCLEAIKSTAETTDYTFFIDSSGKVYFKGKTDSETVKHTVAKDIDEIQVRENNEDLVNKLVLEYKSATKTYDQSGTDKERTKYLRKTDIENEASADIFATSFFEQNNRTQLETVVSLVGVDKPKVGDKLTVKNFAYELENLTIKKIVYNEEKITLYLEKFVSFNSFL